MKVLFLHFLFFFLVLFFPCHADQPREIQWEDLIPEGYADSLLEQKKDQSIWKNLFSWGDDDNQESTDITMAGKSSAAPVVEDLNNQNIKLAGYIVPLDFDFGSETFKDFLLVPYFGACIHVPPPPSNQIVHISSTQLLKRQWLDNAVMVSGILETKNVSNEYGNAGYSMNSANLEILQD